MRNETWNIVIHEPLIRFLLLKRQSKRYDKNKNDTNKVIHFIHFIQNPNNKLKNKIHGIFHTTSFVGESDKF